MKKAIIFFFFLILILPVRFNYGQNWGEQVFAAAETEYDIYKKNFAYTDTTFPVTDIRSADSVYFNINSFNIQNLSVFRAYDGNDYLQNQPVVFFIHGGGWTDGYASIYDFVSISLTGEKGWTLVNVDYRLTSDSVFIADEYCPDRFSCFDSLNRKKAAWYPDNISDVAGAFEWTLKNIPDNGGDTTKIFIFGHSAGGHLVSLFAVHPDFQYLRPYIKGVVSLSGAYEIKSLNYVALGSAIEQTFHGGYFNNDEELDEASPITYINTGSEPPPFYLLHCQFDLPSLPQQKISFYNLLALYDYNVEQDFIPAYTHISEIAALQSIDSLPTVLITNYIQSRIDFLNSVSDEETDGIPLQPELYQNFPNPIEKKNGGTSETTIRFYLSKHDYAEIDVYNILGVKVKTLFAGYLKSGFHNIVFDAKNLPSGLYLYSLKTNGNILAKKLLIIK